MKVGNSSSPRDCKICSTPFVPVGTRLNETSLGTPTAIMTIWDCPNGEEHRKPGGPLHIAGCLECRTLTPCVEARAMGLLRLRPHPDEPTPCTYRCLSGVLHVQPPGDREFCIREDGTSVGKANDGTCHSCNRPICRACGNPHHSTTCRHTGTTVLD